MATREKLALYPVLLAQAVLTRRRAPVLPEAAGPREGLVAIPSGANAADPLRLLIVGDSSAAGVGVAHQDRALAGYLTRTVAVRSGRSVRWQLKARSGVTSQQALRMVLRDPPEEADVAVVALGVNDVVQQVSPRRAIIWRERLADWLLANARVRHVVFAPLPPVHEMPLLPQPLRRVAGDDARAHDEALAAWAATRRDVSHVPIPMTLNAAVMAEDGFHAGEPVYRLCGEALGRYVVDRGLARGHGEANDITSDDDAADDPGRTGDAAHATIDASTTWRQHDGSRQHLSPRGQDLLHHRRV